MQEDWAADPLKLTFIILSREARAAVAQIFVVKVSTEATLPLECPKVGSRGLIFHNAQNLFRKCQYFTHEYGETTKGFKENQNNRNSIWGAFG